ncbi:MAG: zinc-ribbon domain containing protein [Chloroflexi bacterium]|nr:zinc-ribbon domain containing protein [Chloroflexota bacterium]
MAYADRTLTCVECGKPFTFTTAEQEFFASKGYTNDPKRCPSCRELRRARTSTDSRWSGGRSLYPAVCAQCGQETQVPFQPRGDRPVYCSACFSQVRGQSPTLRR